MRRFQGLIGLGLLLSINVGFAMNLIARDKLTPQEILQDLKVGNERFIANKLLHRNFQEEILNTKEQQFPVAVVLSCMDSRNVPSLSFDQGIGDIFSIRIAGNILNNDILGSMEYGTSVVGAKLIVVMGHTNCGAIASACKEVKLGHITDLINKVNPAVQKLKKANPNSSCDQTHFVDEIAEQNVIDVTKEIPQRSPIIAKLLQDKRIKIVGAMYDLSSGKVTFLNEITH